jgi:hypothetical protein
MSQRIHEMKLRVQTNNQGVSRVVQTPPRIDIRKADFDVVRISNADPSESISVRLAEANADHLFDPVPSTSFVSLAPGAHVDWHIATQLGAIRQTRFFTDPPSRDATNHTDIHIEC